MTLKDDEKWVCEKRVRRVRNRAIEAMVNAIEAELCE